MAFNGRLSRRALLAAASQFAAIGVAGSILPAGRLAWGEEIAPQVSGLAEEFTRERLKQFALVAIEAARAGGAQFADVRVQFARLLSITNRPFLFDTATIGIRAVVEGAWGFAGGYELAADDIKSLASLAIERAKAARSRRTQLLSLAPAPVMRDGAWETLIEVDPFTVPVREQQEKLAEARARAQRARSAASTVRSIDARLIWMKSERVFASTEGSIICQRTYSMVPSASVTTSPADDDTISFHSSVEALSGGAYGYEAMSRVDLGEELLRTASEALRIASLPSKSVDVGRYDIVLGTELAANILAGTVGRALELDRALGEKAADEGTSYAMPPEAVLGELSIASKLLTVTADRSRPHANATVGWDEEGVKPDDFVLVKQGVVMDYVTTRRTAPALARWYASRQVPLRSHGCAARSGDRQPILQLPNLAIEPGSAGADIDVLIRDIKRGLYVVHGGGSVDQQLLNAQYGARLVFEIRDGKIVGTLRDAAFQFNTPQFWKSLDALGGPQSARLVNVSVDALTANLSSIGVLSVPARFRQVNVLNTGKQA